MTIMEILVSENLSVADAKKRLSELMNRVAYNKERSLIEHLSTMPPPRSTAEFAPKWNALERLWPSQTFASAL